MDRAPILDLAERARRDGRSELLEPEALDLLARLGLRVPRWRYLDADRPPQTADLAELPGDRVVLKAVSPGLLHKAAAGGVRVVPRRAAAVAAAMAEMRASAAGRDLEGFTLHEHVPYAPALGRELLVGMRWTAEFGAVTVCGLGGSWVEDLAHSVAAPAIASPRLMPSGDWPLLIERSAMAPALRAAGAAEGVPRAALEAVLATFHAAALEWLPVPFVEIEVNPLVWHQGRWLALDVLARLAPPFPHEPVERPLERIHQLLRPRSIAIVGVSRGSNPGRLILRNVLEEGFDPQRVFVIKRGTESIEGCRVVDELAALPRPVDLLIVAVGAARAVEVAEEAIRGRRAKSLLLVSGGLGETPDSERLADRLRGAIAEARSRPDRGPVVNGPNCLGIRSVPGSYDSLFLPRYKLAATRRSAADVAFISQSGALLASKLSRLPGVAFRYAISVGNQLDLTVGDYLAALKDDEALRLYAIYAEGLRPLDGLRLLAAAIDIRRRGGTVLLYRAGRGAAGVRAAAGHTAAIAGDYRVARGLACNAGIVVADSLAEFEGLLQTFAGLRKPKGRRVAIVTNAGFESVAASDHLGALELAVLGDETSRRLRRLLDEHGLGGVVRCANPLDLTPMANDACFGAALRIVLADPEVDAGLVGCVPLTPALSTLPRGAGHPEDLGHPDSLAQRLLRIHRQAGKPWLAAVDAGPAYEPLRNLLRAGGLPTVERIDEAADLLDTFCSAQTTRQS